MDKVSLKISRYVSPFMFSFTRCSPNPLNCITKMLSSKPQNNKEMYRLDQGTGLA